MDIYGSGINFLFSITGKLPYTGHVLPNTKVDDKTFPILPAGTPEKVLRLFCQMLRFEAEKRPSAADASFIIGLFLKDSGLIEQIETVWRKMKDNKGPFEYRYMTFEQAAKLISIDQKEADDKEKPCIDTVFDIDTTCSHSCIKILFQNSIADQKYCSRIAGPPKILCLNEKMCK